WLLENRSVSIDWEVRANAVWRFGRVFLRCPQCAQAGHTDLCPDVAVLARVSALLGTHVCVTASVLQAHGSVFDGGFMGRSGNRPGAYAPCGSGRSPVRRAESHPQTTELSTYRTGMNEQPPVRRVRVALLILSSETRVRIALLQTCSDAADPLR